jgi:hypothetical protein
MIGQFHGFSNDIDHFGGNGNYFWMHLDADSKIRFQCPISPISNCPVALGRIESPVMSSITDCAAAAQSLMPRQSTASVSVFDETNQNLTAAQKELLLWHS